MTPDPLIIHTARGCLALLFIATGLHKSVHPGRFRLVLGAQRILPEQCIRAGASVLSLAELCVGVSLLWPAAARSAALAAAVLLGLYFWVLSLNLARDHRTECGCSLSRRKVPVSGAHLIRNACLILVALVAAMADSARQLHWADLIQVLAAVLSLALLYVSAETLLEQGASALRLERQQ